MNDETRYPPSLGYTVETSWPVLQRAYPDSVIHAITLEDIEAYDWAEQTIKLNDQGSKEFSQSNVYDKEYPGMMPGYPFVAVLDGTPIYGGRILFPGSAMAIQFPVIYLTKVNDTFILAIHPFHSIFPIESDDPAWDAIKDERIRAVFAAEDKLAK